VVPVVVVGDGATQLLGAARGLGAPGFHTGADPIAGADAGAGTVWARRGQGWVVVTGGAHNRGFLMGQI
jgi:hypothetical protein